MMTSRSHLQPDGTVFPPVTPEPPLPPGYADPLAEAEVLDELSSGEPTEGTDDSSS